MRKPKVSEAGLVFHAMARGNNQMDIFLSNDDRMYFLRLLDEALMRYDFDLYGYVLMTNHYHLELEQAGDFALGDFMKYLNGKYARYYDWKYGHKGHVFQGRYQGIVIHDDPYFMQVSRYIHLNPVKAGIVSSPELYRWSSYGTYLGWRHEKFVDTEKVMSYFGEGREGLKHFRDFTEAANQGAARDAIDLQIIEDMRDKD